ncbi:MAG: hypothetical protein GYB53_12565 [Rhodobacteraceae bacterium]|nr:hypothetical protein [Paracoccaceae bacterium]MBR9822893.1 hypothetical protein [Paracoccaceae bacterium]
MATFDRDADGTPVFVIGLTMAGAISAGAYTAGVTDYLVRAMQAHNARVGQPGGPRHRVMIKALSGASAGGMCAGLIAANLTAIGSAGEPGFDAPRHVSGPGGSWSYVLSRIYDAWVRNVRMWDRDSGAGLLALDDIAGARPTIDQAAVGMEAPGAISVLNGLHLDEVATAALQGIPSWPETRQGFDFLSSELDIFLTTTAINSTVYQVAFGGGDPFVMQQHGLVRHFRLSGLGAGPALPSPWLEDWQDEGMALSPRVATPELPLVAPDGGNWLKLTVASLATGAFPLALAPRIVDATPRELGFLPEGDENARGGALPYDIPAGQVARPVFGAAGAETRTPYVALDGGAIDNEPFAHARFTLRQRGEGGGLLPNPRGGGAAHRAVLMVDPFPEGARFSVVPVPKLLRMLGLSAVAGKLLGTLVGQARFKPAELVQAQDPDVHSRFLITPSRSGDGVDAVGAGAICCGLLGGFGGFLDESFRLHDFALGQRNCQWFLQRHFVLDAANPVLDLPDGPERAGTDVAIIDPGSPVPGGGEVPLHDWAAMEGAALAGVVAQLDTRLKRLGKVEIGKLQGTSWLLRHVLTTVWNKLGGWGLRAQVTRFAATAMLRDLVLRDQHQGYRELDPAQRVLLAGLLGAGGKALSAAELRVAVLEAQGEGALPGAELPDEGAIARFLQGQWHRGILRRSLGSLVGVARYRIDLDRAVAAGPRGA